MQHTEFFNDQRLYKEDMDFLTNGVTGSILDRFFDWFDYGVISGLTVSASSVYTGNVQLSLGKAYNSKGERINITADIDNLSYNGTTLSLVAGTYDVLLNYVPQVQKYATNVFTGISYSVWFSDGFGIPVVKVGTDTPPVDCLTLARVTVSSPGVMSFDYNGMRRFSIKNIGGLVMGGYFQNYVVSSDPVGLGLADAGTQWYNSTDGQLKMWDGSSPRILG
jgi:hypothetical protein